MRKVSSSKPASGTSCASVRSGDPANVTNAPRTVSASATAIAGSTCPAVPPAAITHRTCLCGATMSDVKEDSDGGEQDDEARAAVGEERQRNPGQRRDAHHGRNVERGLPTDEHGQAGGEQLPERVAAAACDLQPSPGEE